MEFLVLCLQPFEDADSLFDRRFGDVDLLEATHHALALLEVAVVLLVGGGADEAYLSAFEVGLEHIGAVERAVACRARANQGVDFVDIDDGIAFGDNAFHHSLDAFLEVAAIGCSCHHRAHVHLVDGRSPQTFGHIAALNAFGQAIDERRLADTGFSHMQRVVLFASAEYLDGTIEFSLTSDERIVVGEVVVDAGDEVAPPDVTVGVAFGVEVSRDVVEIVVVAIILRRSMQWKCLPIHGHDHAIEELPGIVGEGMDNFIKCLRVFEVHDGIECMGNIHLVVPGTGCHVFADGDDLDELGRGKQFVVTDFFGYGVNMLVEIVQKIDSKEDWIDLITRKNGFQLVLVCNAIKQVFGSHKLMSLVKCYFESHCIGIG